MQPYAAIRSRSTRLLIGVLLLTTPLCPQTSKAAAENGTLSGRAFLITRGGDIKPARMAIVYVFSGDAKAEFDRNVAKALASYHPRNNETSDIISCYDNSEWLSKSLQGMTLPNIRRSETDEDGRIEMTNLKPDSYSIYVDGPAGIYLNIWVEAFTIEAGKTTAIKLSSPIFACERSH